MKTSTVSANEVITVKHFLLQRASINLHEAQRNPNIIDRALTPTTNNLARARSTSADLG